MAKKLRGNTTMEMVNAGIAQRNKPITLNNTTTTFSQPTAQQQQMMGDSYANNDSKMIGQSFERMGLGKVGGLGGRMGQLEQASMRLAQAASDRRMGEAEQEFKLKGNLLQRESDILSQRQSQQAGYSSPFEMQTNLAGQRRENEKKQREQENIARRASITASRGQPQGAYAIDRRGRRVYS